MTESRPAPPGFAAFDRDDAHGRIAGLQGKSLAVGAVRILGDWQAKLLVEEPTTSIEIPHDQAHMFDNPDRRTTHGISSSLDCRTKLSYSGETPVNARAERLSDRLTNVISSDFIVRQ